jgi:large subunit ribosomal protein L20
MRATKGYRFARSKKESAARDALRHAGAYAFRDRKAKKRNFRRLWTVRINAAVREAGLKNYATFIDSLKKKNCTIDRKVLASLAKDHPEVFARFIAAHTAKA